MSAKRTRMAFVCNQDWNAMEPTDHGRYCTLCRKEVIDFTNASDHKVRSLANQEVCGFFRVEQVEDGITPITLPNMRYVAASFVTFLGLEVAAQADTSKTSPVKTEVVAGTAASGTVKDESRPAVGEQGLTKKEIRQIRKRIRKNDYSRRSFMNLGRFGFYRSKHFPFIVIRRRHLAGAYATL